ncbi:MAG: glycosyltransferase [Phycisphaerales bacterium]|nr:glycosyltransferase [Phycisphaerales bacterium]
MPVLDAVIPAFEPDTRVLERAVASAWACVDAMGGGEVVVVDDGSAKPVAIDPDGHGKSGACGVTVLRQPNVGPSAARNAGLQRTEAAWVLLLDADDEAVVDGVCAMVPLGERLNASCVLGARVHVHADGRTDLHAVPAEWADRALPSAGDVFRPISLFSSTGCLVSRRVLEAGVRFDADLRIGEDRDFFRRCAEVGPVGVCSKTVVRYTLHESGNNLSASMHLDRRIRDHAILCDRWCDASSREHFDEATRWLINAAAKRGIRPESWDKLIATARAHGLSVPIKARLRRALRTLGSGAGKERHT